MILMHTSHHRYPTMEFGAPESKKKRGTGLNNNKNIGRRGAESEGKGVGSDGSLRCFLPHESTLE